MTKVAFTYDVQLEKYEVYYCCSFDFLITASAKLVSAQTGRTKAQPGTDKSSAATENEEARLKRFLDKNHGYRDNESGYYNPKAGTYTDAEGGIVDNWSGYTYKSGSYKSKIGDFWNAPKKTFELTTGEKLKSDDITSAEAITLLRETVEEQGGYDKDYIRKSMMARIKAEHPLTPSKAGKRP